MDAAYRNQPIVGLRREVKSACETIEVYRVDGRYFEKSQEYEKDAWDLVLPTRRLWLVVMRIGDTVEMTSAVFNSQEKHDQFCKKLCEEKGSFKYIKTVETEIPNE